MVKLEKENFYVYFSGPRGEISLIKEALTVFNEGAVFMKSFQDGFWDGYERFYDNKNKRFDFGFLHLIIDVLKKEDVQYEIVDNDEFVKVKPTNLTPILRPHQINAVKSFFKHNTGIIKIPTRGGKTFVMAECIKQYRELKRGGKCLIVLDSTDLLNQTVDELKKFYKTDYIGVIGYGKFYLHDITVCMIQTLTSILKKDTHKYYDYLVNFIEETEFLCVDEIHEFGSETRIDIIKLFVNRKFFLALSATPYKSQKILHNYNIMRVTNGIIFTVKEDELIERGFLVKSKMLLLYTEYDEDYMKKLMVYEHGTPYSQPWSYVEIKDRFYAGNKERNGKIKSIIEILLELNLNILVMTSIKDHGYELERITGFPFICGDHTTKERDERKNHFLSNKGGCLIASDIYKKGITLPEAEVLIVTSSSKEDSTLMQKRGRVLGTSDGKNKALIIDFIDNIKYFSEHGSVRINMYQEMFSEDELDVLETNVGDFKQQFRLKTHEWFS